MRGGVVLFSTDDNIGLLSGCARGLPENFLGWWDDSSLLGNGIGRVPLNWTSALITTLPLLQFVNLVHAVDLSLAAVLLFALLRRMGCSRASAMFGALVAFWCSSNLALTYGGHIPKFSVLVFGALALLGIKNMAGADGRAWALLAGGAVGFALVEQQDVGLFFGLFIGAYAVFMLFRMNTVSWQKRVTTFLVPMGIMAAWPAIPSLLQGYTHNIQNVASTAAEDPAVKWDFVTQWSFPPDEAMALVAPGYIGWRSSEPNGPYWGRLGRSAGWEQTGQGFMNFKLDDWYLGVIPVAFALWACGAAWRQRRAATGALAASPAWSERRAETIFWGCATFIALLLAMGKFSPLYQLFYQLPVVNNIRAPIKFLQVFQVGLGILAAYGMDRMMGGVPPDSQDPEHGGAGGKHLLKPDTPTAKGLPASP
jgi:hypothetical protein